MMEELGPRSGDNFVDECNKSPTSRKNICLDKQAGQCLSRLLLEIHMNQLMIVSVVYTVMG